MMVVFLIAVFTKFPNSCCRGPSNVVWQNQSAFGSMIIRREKICKCGMPDLRNAAHPGIKRLCTSQGHPSSTARLLLDQQHRRGVEVEGKLCDIWVVVILQQR
jgi:hypothetical protein